MSVTESVPYSSEDLRFSNVLERLFAFVDDVMAQVRGILDEESSEFDVHSLVEELKVLINGLELPNKVTQTLVSIIDDPRFKDFLNNLMAHPETLTSGTLTREFFDILEAHGEGSGISPEILASLRTTHADMQKSMTDMIEQLGQVNFSAIKTPADMLVIIEKFGIVPAEQMAEMTEMVESSEFQVMMERGQRIAEAMGSVSAEMMTEIEGLLQEAMEGRIGHEDLLVRIEALFEENTERNPIRFQGLRNIWKIGCNTLNKVFDITVGALPKPLMKYSAAATAASIVFFGGLKFEGGGNRAKHIKNQFGHGELLKSGIPDLARWFPDIDFGSAEAVAGDSTESEIQPTPVDEFSDMRLEPIKWPQNDGTGANLEHIRIGENFKYKPEGGKLHPSEHPNLNSGEHGETPVSYFCQIVADTDCELALLFNDTKFNYADKITIFVNGVEYTHPITFDNPAFRLNLSQGDNNIEVRVVKIGPHELNPYLSHMDSLNDLEEDWKKILTYIMLALAGTAITIGGANSILTKGKDNKTLAYGLWELLYSNFDLALLAQLPVFMHEGLDILIKDYVPSKSITFLMAFGTLFMGVFTKEYFKYDFKDLIKAIKEFDIHKLTELLKETPNALLHLSILAQLASLLGVCFLDYETGLKLAGATMVLNSGLCAGIGSGKLLMAIIDKFKGREAELRDALIYFFGFTPLLVNVILFLAKAKNKIAGDWIEPAMRGTAFASEIVFIAGLIMQLVSYHYSRLRAETTAKEEAEKTAKVNARCVPEKWFALFDKPLEKIHPNELISMEKVTVLFSDIREYTRLMEEIAKEEVENNKNPGQDAVAFLNSYFGKMVTRISSKNGLIDKFIGDAVMSIFPESPEDALKAAISMCKAVDEINTTRGSNTLPDKPKRRPIDIGIGLHTGPLSICSIGGKTGDGEFEERMELTVIGDGVNLASRAEGLTKMFGAKIIITDDLKQELNHSYELLYLGKVQVKGKNDPVDIYEVLDGLKKGEKKKKLAIQLDLSDGIEFYQNEKWLDAKKEFRKVLKNNKTAQLYLKSIKFIMNSKSQNFDFNGALVMKDK